MWCLQQVLGSQWQKAAPVTALLIFSYLALMSPRLLRTYRLPPCDLQQRPKPSAQVVISRWCFTEAPCFSASCFQVKSCRLEWGFHIDSNSLERTRQDSSMTRVLFPSVVVIRNVCYAPLYRQRLFFINRTHILSRVADKYLPQTPLKLEMSKWPRSSQWVVSRHLLGRPSAKAIIILAKMK